jgi:5-formaminoimidazole-4-carboxamide-1-(beta)-D-ribofuranosyl 5'-monophosphate synthetase
MKYLADPMEKITLSMVGSHSALDVCRGAKEEGFRTLVFCEPGREKTYKKHFKNIVDEAMLIGNFSDVAGKDAIQLMKSRNSVFVPNRSFEAYMNFDYDTIEKMDISFFGNRKLLRIEERTEKKGQYYLMKKSGIRFPKQFASPEDIDRVVIVKASESERNFQREFFFASSTEDFSKKSKDIIAKGKATEKSIENSVIEEFVLGVPVNFNFFYSPLKEELDLMGTDFRRQTSLDGFLRLPAEQQLLLKEKPQFKEAGHVAATVLESMLEKAFEAGESFVNACKEFGGIIGPFALQSLIVPGPPKEDIVVYDISPRIPGSPGTMFTPYTHYKYGQNISVGKRIAMEIKEASKNGDMQKITS